MTKRITEKTANTALKARDPLLHIAVGPCNGHGWRIGRWEDETEQSFTNVGEFRTLREIVDFAAGCAA